MYGLNHTLEKNVAAADGCYLDAQSLRPLEQYLQSYTARLHAYEQLRDGSEQLILQSLRKLSQAYPELVQQHGPRCKYDMTEVLRYLALAVLRDDDIFFKETMVSWLDTVLLAHKKTAHCVAAYRHLQEAIATTLPASDAMLVRPYLDLVIQALQSHA
jgi:hypothetical protein